jgi:hypothetical protein
MAWLVQLSPTLALLQLLENITATLVNKEKGIFATLVNMDATVIW